MKVEVAYATPEKQQIIALDVAEGTTAKAAVLHSGITEVFPQIDLDAIDMGIFGKVIKTPETHALRDGDRVELYRPLLIDPKQARLNRARKKAS